MSLLEGIFSRGDRRLAPVVESAYAQGAIFAGWMEGFSLAPWLGALAEHGLTVGEYTAARKDDAPLPWAHLHSGLSDDYFRREYQRALTGKTTEDCRYSACRQCGICDTKAGPSSLDRLSCMKPDELYANKLNKTQRDQESHTVQLDQYGRVIIRGGHDIPKAARPPALDPRLAAKQAQLLILYERQGAAAYLSQLELQHVFDRAMRKAALPLSFSQGFHPLPLVTFGRALPVGVASEAEWFSVFLREPRSLEETLVSLNQSLPQGLRVLSVESLGLKEKYRDKDSESYEVYDLGGPLSFPAFARAWQTVEKAPTLMWNRETKKGVRELDARRFFTSITCTDEGQCSLKLDWSQGYVSPLALSLFALQSVGFNADVATLRLLRKRDNP